MLDLFGIGNACIDIVGNVDDAFLEAWKFPKAICSDLALERANHLEQALPSPRYIPGGCAANTTSVVVALGGRAAFAGRVADDPVGQIFINDMARRGVHYPCTPDAPESAGGSTRVFTMVTQDAERTFASYYGVQIKLCADDIDEEIAAQSRFIYLDGYALNAPGSIGAFLKAIRKTKDKGGRVVFAPNDLSILEKFPANIAQLAQLSDIIMCSTQEAAYMTGSADPKTAAIILRSRHKAGSVSNGAQGVYVFDESGLSHIPCAKPPAPVIDTNGAGDAFAGGFIYGLSHDMGLNKAAALGNLCAAHIITHAGARPVHDYANFPEEVE